MNMRCYAGAVLVVSSVVLSACAGLRPENTSGHEVEPACSGSSPCTPQEAGGASPPELATASEVSRTDEFKNASLHQAPGPVSQEPKPVSPGKQTVEQPLTWQGEKTAKTPGKVSIIGLNLERNALEIVAGERIVSYRVMTLTQPSRLVVEILNGQSGFAQRRIMVNRLGIAAVSFEQTHNILQVVLEGDTDRQLIPYRIRETERGLRVIVTNQ